MTNEFEPLTCALKEKVQLLFQEKLLSTFPSMVCPEYQKSTPVFSTWKEQVYETLWQDMTTSAETFIFQIQEESLENIENAVDLCHDCIDLLENEYQKKNKKLVYLDNTRRKELLDIQIKINEYKTNLELISCYF